MPEEQTTLTPAVNDQDHTQGASNAPITLVEYGDFECPDCGNAYPVIQQVQKRLGDQLRFVYRHYPLPQHPHAMHAAEASEAANAQGKFWEMHDYIFEHQPYISDRHLLQAAEELGLDVKRFLKDMEHHSYVEHIKKDAESGDESGIAGTPTLFINGQQYDDEVEVDTLLNALKVAAH